MPRALPVWRGGHGLTYRLRVCSLPLLPLDGCSPPSWACLHSPPLGSPMSPELPQALAFFGARSPAVQIFGCLQGIPGQQGGGWAGWLGVSPAPGGPQACDVLSFASAGPRAAHPLSRLAMGVGGCCWSWPSHEASTGDSLSKRGGLGVRGWAQPEASVGCLENVPCHRKVHLPAPAGPLRSS